MTVGVKYLEVNLAQGIIRFILIMQVSVLEGKLVVTIVVLKGIHVYLTLEGSCLLRGNPWVLNLVVCKEITMKLISGNVLLPIIFNNEG
jgi:hypothetical protein